MPTLQQTIASFTRNLLENSFGKVPDKVDVYMDERSIIIHMEKFIGIVMTDLVDTEDMDAMRSIRELMVEHLFPSIIEYIQEYTVFEVSGLYFDWDDDNLSGTLIGIMENDLYQTGKIQYKEMDRVNAAISEVTNEVQKTPKAVYSYWADPDVLIVIREGLLLKLEKGFVKQGAVDVLRKVKRGIEKDVIIHKARIPAILERKASGLYLDWKFEDDKSVIVYVFEPEPA
ncbi:Na-translocating system protein MpsC family protein [Saccharibacillus sp. CPCC 101409]|uniref:Na-translocating system protein MpsC family protein n=1 Tax=Saccharibacillus sp. CPCC 101409 TaxID=3058041 RepID=UPI002672620C|nr:Na-translocating system protein MpsC family protein [Saccharibacillus sp. CPCC 101409]MDO3412291.1 Na-translocating system protein MpsC family protein [Saccharibacillus sp. CPCC 101409]